MNVDEEYGERGFATGERVRRSLQREEVGNLLVQNKYVQDSSTTTAALEDSTHHVGMKHVRYIQTLSYIAKHLTVLRRSIDKILCGSVWMASRASSLLPNVVQCVRCDHVRALNCCCIERLPGCTWT